MNRNPWGYAHDGWSLYDYVDDCPTIYVEPLSKKVPVNSTYHATKEELVAAEKYAEEHGDPYNSLGTTRDMNKDVENKKATGFNDLSSLVGNITEITTDCCTCVDKWKINTHGGPGEIKVGWKNEGDKDVMLNSDDLGEDGAAGKHVSERSKTPTFEHLKSTHPFMEGFALAYPAPQPRRGYVHGKPSEDGGVRNDSGPAPAGLV